MIYRLMKRDYAWRIAIFSAMLAVGPALATRPSPTLRALMMVMPILFLAILARPQQRATLFEAALPIPARDLFLARLLALLTTVWFPLAVCAAAVHDGSVLNLEWAALLALLVLLPLTTRAREFVSPAWMAPVECSAGLGIGGAGLYFLPPAIFLAGCTLAFAAVFLKTWTTLPPSFECAPREAVAQPPIAVSGKAPAPVWWTFTRQAIPWVALIYVPLNASQFLLGNELFACCFCVSLYFQIRTHMAWMAALPVPRRAFLLFALVPSALPMIVAAALVSGRAADVPLQYKSGTADVGLPLEFWRHAPGGVAPMAVAPWGESYQLVPETFLGYPLYNPYGTGPQSTTRFLEWQHRRAQQAVNARPLTGLRVRILFTAEISALSLLLACFAESLYWFRLSRFSQANRTWVALGIFGPLFAIPLVLEATHLGRHSFGSPTAALLRALPWQIAGRLPDNLAIVLAAAAIPTLLLLWLLDRQIRESEVADKTLVRPRP